MVYYDEKLYFSVLLLNQNFLKITPYQSSISDAKLSQMYNSTEIQHDNIKCIGNSCITGGRITVSRSTFSEQIIKSIFINR